MNLYRMTYIRDGFPRGITFAGKSNEWAIGFAEKWCEGLRVVLLTLRMLRKCSRCHKEQKCKPKPS